MTKMLFLFVSIENRGVCVIYILLLLFRSEIVFCQLYFIKPRLNAENSCQGKPQQGHYACQSG